MNSGISGLDAATKARIAGVVLFGYTKNKQNSGKIQNFPGDRVLTFCDKSDGVCGGGLSVTAGHFVYVRNGDIGKAVEYLAGNLRKAGYKG
jgi:cutinase